MQINDQTFDALMPQVWHDIVKLRVDVFVVEQACAYAELDGLDVAPLTRHIWLGEGTRIAAYLRLLEEPLQSRRARRIGRVVTHPEARGSGLASRLIEHALATSEGPWLLHAQAHLEHWYSRLGFVRDGAGFFEDGIPHVPMVRRLS